MNPKRKVGVFVGSAFALMLPYFAFVMFFSLRFPQNRWPIWFTDTILVWFAANFLILVLVAKRVFTKQGPQGLQDSPSSAKTKRAIWIARIVASYLVIVWSILFINGARGTLEGKYPLNRALPAGVFLLFFIVLFAWSVYRTFRKKA